MSTVDPDAARRERAARVPAEKELVLPGILALVGGALATGAILTLAQVPASGDVSENTVGLLAAMGVALFGGVLAVGGLLLWGRASFRNPRLLGWMAPIALVLLGSAVGFVVATGGYVVAGVLFGVGVVCLLLALTARRRRVGLAAREDAIMRSSAPVEGEVTNQGYTHFGDSDRILTAVTYAFTDAQGTRRFVQRPAVIDVAAPIIEGERVDVWFDRRNPSDEKSIVVRRRRSN